MSQFPKDFIFGTATSAYQIEGSWNVDGRGPSIWDTFSHLGDKTKGDTGDTACNTYQDPATDIEIMQSLGLDAYRFSISWSRILPSGEKGVNQKGLDYYSRLVDQLLEKNIKPFPTLFHWDMPQALQDKYKGFASRETAYLFADYCETVVKALGDRVKNWITLNEPWEHAALGHLMGEHAPGKTNPAACCRVSHHQLLAHGLAVERIRSLAPEAKVGITLSQTLVFPESEHPKDRQAARLANQFFNQYFLDGLYKGKYPDPFWKKIRLFHPGITAGDMQTISTPTDFLGINYYSREYAAYKWYIPFFNFWVNTKEPAEDGFSENGKDYTAMGWEVYPQGLYDLLISLKENYGNPPVYITENGAAYKDEVINTQVDDPKRIQYLQQHFDKAAQALQDGVNLKGYFIWSLIDNFEWAFGFKKRFGLVHVDHQTQKRTPKSSAYWLKDLISGQESRK